MPPPATMGADSDEGETVDISTQDGVADAYLSRPRGQDGSHPGVLFIMNAFGLRPRIEEMVDRIAARGFVVLAPNVLYRDGRVSNMEIPDLEDPAQRNPFFARLRPAMAELTPERIASDGAASATLRDRKPAVCHHRLLHGVGASAGGSPPPTWSVSRRSPPSTAGAGERRRAISCFGHADNDQSMTPEHVATLEQARGRPDVVPLRAIRRGRPRLHDERHRRLR
jgi:carboxymethylenebutenolidase